MSSSSFNRLFFVSLLPSILALPSLHHPRSTYPFTSLVAFGDEFSDNGNGSYAHGITGDPATVYGFGTWTNGPVAVSYLSTLLSTPLTDYAFGGCCGGSSGGASFDNAYTQAGAGAPSLVDQIANYSSTGYRGIKQSLAFVWVGQNDLSFHTDAFWEGDPKNNEFASTAAAKTSAAVKTLIDAGAPYVLVANIYPKHRAPVNAKYLCGTSTTCVETWGRVIQNANSAINASLAQFGPKAIYYDAFGFVGGLLDKATENGFTAPLTDFCDGMGNVTWDDCMVKGNAGKYFWMNFVQPTARVHELIARDMQVTVNKHFGL
ncbi:carbohydrate esterase family 16 protein [Pleomassaria siparia CBS 279.74]|uniref:Carbohydrate esterase family 16 protein n=1 Tax=Pleomassaria siparia CBS 279.74 TaxID=1314801 RepID=A0A6G1K7N0_9PLEO|nr:carbohydrate esterase family 16 protein [Pleomassaria siparia CBS 279.74]